jgi:hypothetical protein
LLQRLWVSRPGLLICCFVQELDWVGLCVPLYDIFITSDRFFNKLRFIDLQDILPSQAIKPTNLAIKQHKLIFLVQNPQNDRSNIWQFSI